MRHPQCKFPEKHCPNCEVEEMGGEMTSIATKQKPKTTWLYHACLRCQGDLYLDYEGHTPYYSCLQCGYIESNHTVLHRTKVK